MSTLYVIQGAYRANLSSILLDFIDDYEVDTVICNGPRRLSQWCDRWMLRCTAKIPHSVALERCDAVVAILPRQDDALEVELRGLLKPYVIFICDDNGVVIQIH